VSVIRAAEAHQAKEGDEPTAILARADERIDGAPEMPAGDPAGNEEPVVPEDDDPPAVGIVDG
jgi:hypothetical protein